MPNNVEGLVARLEKEAAWYETNQYHSGQYVLLREAAAALTAMQEQIAKHDTKMIDLTELTARKITAQAETIAWLTSHPSETA